MKRIILIRHGKSAWNDPNLRDHDRPLAERGERDVTFMADRLQSEDRIPELILCSSALRATQTAELIVKKLGINPQKLKTYKELYHASPFQMATVLKDQDDSINTIALVGHNPGMNEFIEKIDTSFDNLPTSGQYGILLPIKKWAHLDFKTMETWFLDYPKKHI